jgi:hypothetical protein
MAAKSSYLMSGLAAVAVMIVALPAAKGVGTPKKEPPPLLQVNRAVKGDRMSSTMTIAVRKPADMRREPISMREPARPAKPAEKPQTIMDGCEPSFSPVVVPSMAHLAARCIG